MNGRGKKPRREFEYNGYFVRIDATPQGYTALVFEDVTDPALKFIKAPPNGRGMESITAQAKEYVDLLIKKKNASPQRR